jgi:Tol biopolymer transport system component
VTPRALYAIVLVSWALFLVSSGCSTVAGLPLDEISESPIAFVYWKNEAARKRAEILAEMKGESFDRYRAGVANVENLGSYITGGGFGRPGLAQFPGRIALLNPRTLEIQDFPAAPPNARPLAWSPDHERLLFASQHRDGRTMQLYEFDMKSGELTTLTRGPDYHLEGAYGPSGQIAMAWARIARGRPPESGLDLADDLGGARRRLFEGMYPAGVRWSPQGDAVVFVQADMRPKRTEQQRDRSQIFARSVAPKADIERLVPGADPVFSPDGEWIIYAAKSGDHWQLRRVRPDGSARRSFGQTSRDERNPAVSPDGRHLVYTAEDSGIGHLYVKRFDGSGDRILLSEGAAAYPVW